MNNFIIRTKDNLILRFQYFDVAAPQTVLAFKSCLPFTRIFYHAKVSGQEIWIDNAPLLDIIQENSSVYANPGEIVIGPKRPERNKIAGCMGIFYGEGRLLDGGNIFGKVADADLPLLQKLGDRIWKGGVEELFFE